MRIARALLVAAAIVTCAWFVIVARQAHEKDAAAAIVGPGGGRSPAVLAHADKLLDAASFLNPGRDVENLRAEQLLEQRRYPAAAAVIGRVIRAEPQNLQGWINLATLSLNDPRAARRTGVSAHALTAHIAALDPVDARHL